MISTRKILKFEFVVVNCVCVRSYKMKFVSWMINQNFDSFDAIELKDRLKSCLKALEYSSG